MEFLTKVYDGDYYDALKYTAIFIRMLILIS